MCGNGLFPKVKLLGIYIDGGIYIDVYTCMYIFILLKLISEREKGRGEEEEEGRRETPLGCRPICTEQRLNPQTSYVTRIEPFTFLVFRMTPQPTESPSQGSTPIPFKHIIWLVFIYFIISVDNNF